MDDFYFRQLRVYINSKELVKHVYGLLKKFPEEEKYALCNQIRRAVTSIPIILLKALEDSPLKKKLDS